MKVYAYFFESEDENGKVEESLEDLSEYAHGRTVEEMNQEIVNFFNQTDEAYLDKYGCVHEIYKGKDMLFCYLFTVTDNDWYEIVGNTGALLDNNDVPEQIRSGVEKIYNTALKMAA